uniref:Uncharacterized protein n=1 Tax=Arundo donax TaxID=35708 RepID=A0A0A8Y357_ARUDO
MLDSWNQLPRRLCNGQCVHVIWLDTKSGLRGLRCYAGTI